MSEFLNGRWERGKNLRRQANVARMLLRPDEEMLS